MTNITCNRILKFTIPQVFGVTVKDLLQQQPTTTTLFNGYTTTNQLLQTANFMYPRSKNLNHSWTYYSQMTLSKKTTKQYQKEDYFSPITYLIFVFFFLVFFHHYPMSMSRIKRKVVFNLKIYYKKTYKSLNYLDQL